MQEVTFADKLREAAVALAKGDYEHIDIKSSTLMSALAGKQSADKPAAYIRMIMGRVPEVMEQGRISIKKFEVEDAEHDDFGMLMYRVTIAKDKKRKVFTQKDIDRIAAKERNKIAKQLMELSPNLANYAPEEYATLAKVVEDYRKIIHNALVTEGE